jgi:hypothetical protein
MPKESASRKEALFLFWDCIAEPFRVLRFAFQTAYAQQAGTTHVIMGRQPKAPGANNLFAWGHSQVGVRMIVDDEP